MSFRAAITLIVALTIGVCILGSVQTSPSFALAPVDDGIISKEEAFRLKKLFETPSNASAQPAKMAARRQAMTVAARSRWTGSARLLATRGGLAGVAAGIWVQNGVTLYYGLQGEPDPVPLHVSPEFRQAELALEGSSGTGGGVMRYYKSDGTLVGSGMVLDATYSFTGSNTCTVTFSYAGTGSGQQYVGTVGLERLTGGTGGCGGSVFASAWSGQPNSSPYQDTATDSSDGSRTYRFYTSDSGGSNAGIKRYFGPSVIAGQSSTWNNPVFDVGPGTLLQTPPSGGSLIESQPQQTELFYNDVLEEGCPTGTVSSPEAPTVPEVCPDYFPEKWEEEFEEELQPAPGESPYSDPDEDGIPNHEDPDDDGDGIPDQDDDQPYVNPALPDADPDEDGIPNRDDPDQDGDGIPNEDDPEPFAPTDPADLPNDNPYADPDEDGIPNRDDPDQDGDGIPNEDDTDPFTPTQPDDLPMWHPFADPDGDGQRNNEDKDDDQDLVEDWEDPSPWSPSTTDPDADQDGDGIPDISDPWPGNPYAPQDPSRDSDTDGVPDYKDPEPENPDSPWGNPQNVPDRRAAPEGDPDPWSRSSTGNPNVPSSPSNPAYPSGSPQSETPPDISTGLDSPPEVSRDEPDDPTTSERPDDPNKPPSDSSCPVVEPPKFDLPEVELANVFPFSLVLRFWDLMGSVVQFGVSTPSIAVPGFGEITPGPTMDYIVGTCKAILAVVLNAGMGLWFYRYITGRGSE